MRTEKYLNSMTALTTATVFVIESMIYYRSAENELPEIYHDSLLPWLLPIAIFAGLNDALEVYDHIVITSQPQVPESTTRNQAVFTTDPLKMSIGAVLALPLLACVGAHLLQGAALARSFRSEDDIIQNLLVISLALPALAKFLFMTVPHVAHTLNGTREHFSLSVTHNEVPKIMQSSMPSFKWWMSLFVMIWLHLPEGELIASQIANPSIKLLATYGFALAESLPHINQLEQIGSNINTTKFNQLTTPQLSMTVVIGLLAGLIHASQTILAVMATSKENTGLHQFGPIAFEFMIGLTEGVQHGVPAANKASNFIKHTIFGAKKPLETMTQGSQFSWNASIS